MFEIDHLFMFVSQGAPEAEALTNFGLLEGTSIVHPGQGTANRRFFFHNAMLELIYITNQAEAQSDHVAPLKLLERSMYQTSGYSPFGLCLRLPGSSAESEVPFSTFEYQPQYLPPGASIKIASGTHPAEPLIFYMPSLRRPDDYPSERAQPLNHPVGFKEVTGLRFTLPQSEIPSEAARIVETARIASFSTGSSYAVELRFDNEQQRKSHDFQPLLPLSIRY